MTALKDARDGEQEETEEEAVVLKMNVIDEKEAKIGEKAKDDDHLSVLHGGNALENGGRGGIAAGTGEQLRETRLEGEGGIYGREREREVERDR